MRNVTAGALRLVVSAALLAACGGPLDGGARPSTAALRASAQRDRAVVETILYAFKGGDDGIGPDGAMVMDAHGAIYGTTSRGGQSSCYDGCGTIYELSPSGSGYTERIIYRFRGRSDGGGPAGGLTTDSSGALYGTTGSESSGCPPSCGTVYELLHEKSGWIHKVLYRFAGGLDGYGAFGVAIVDSSGTLYGTTYAGGTHGAGTAYELKPAKSGYEKSTIFSMGRKHDAHPVAPLLLGKDGALYGTAMFSSVFELTPRQSHYAIRILHLLSGSGGSIPYAPVISGPGGTLYGTTYEGGVANRCKSRFGCGTAFELSPASKGYKETVFRFDHIGGAYPLQALLLGKNGALFGATNGGGLETQACAGREPTYGCGVAFELVAAGSGFKETVLHKFTGGSDGAKPSSPLIADSSGSLIGAAGGGGRNHCQGGCGVIFRITP